MDKIKKNLIQLHIAVLLFGLAGLFGKFLTLPPLIIVFGRVFFSSILLFFILFYSKQNLRLNTKIHYFYLSILGLILSLHWITFFKSIQVSSVAIGLLSFSTFPIFTSFFEPLIIKEKIKLQNILISFITLFGIGLVIPKFELSNNITQGALWGVASGLTFSILSILNRKYVKNYPALVISFYQNIIASLILFPFIFLFQFKVTLSDLFLLILLGMLFTAVAHTLFIKSLENIKATTASIITCLEPVYGILFALIILQERPTIRIFLGGLIILFTAFYSSIKSSK